MVGSCSFLNTGNLNPFVFDITGMWKIWSTKYISWSWKDEPRVTRNATVRTISRAMKNMAFAELAVWSSTSGHVCCLWAKFFSSEAHKNLTQKQHVWQSAYSNIAVLSVESARARPIDFDAFVVEFDAGHRNRKLALHWLSGLSIFAVFCHALVGECGSDWLWMWVVNCHMWLLQINLPCSYVTFAVLLLWIGCDGSKPNKCHIGLYLVPLT